MHRYELNPRLMSAEDITRMDRRDFLMWLAAGAVSATAFGYFVKYLVDLSRFPANKTEPPIPFNIPKSCMPYFAKLASMGVPEQLREGIARTIQTESGFNHYARGRHEDFGLFQITSPKLEDAVETALIGTGSGIEKAASRLILPSLSGIPKKVLTRYNSPRSKKREIARDKTVIALKRKIINNKDADFYVGSGAWLYCSEDARRICEKNGIPYSNDITDAIWNAPERVMLALRTSGEDWRSSRYVPTITKARKFPRYQLQGQC